MASTLTAIGVPKRITLGNANLATQVILPRGTRSCTIYFVTNAGKYSKTGTDGAAIGDDYATVNANTSTKIAIDRIEHGHPASVYLASATGSTVVEVLPTVRA